MVRHYFGQHVTDNANLEIARQRLRHKSIEITARFYAHQDDVRRKAAALDHSLLSKPDINY